MWQKIKGLKEQRSQFVVEMQGIIKKGEDEKRDINADEQKAFDELRTKADNLQKQIDNAEAVYALDQSQRDNANNGGLPGREPIDPNRPLAETRQIDGFAVKDLRRYSLLRAIRACAERRALDGVEKEISDELSKRAGKSAQGFYFPTDLPTGVDFANAEKRTLNLTTGTGAKATILDASNFIDLLRNKTVVQAAGCRVISGLQGDLALPKQTGAGTFYWVADEAAPTTSNPTIGQVTFSPNTGGAFTDLSRKFLLQSSVSAEAFVRDDLAKLTAIGIDTAALNGSGASNQPLGLLQNGSIGTVAVGTNGGVPTWANVVAMETNVAANNADAGKLCYVSNTKVRGLFKATLKNNVAGSMYFWQDGDAPGEGIVNGYRTLTTNSMPSNLVKGTSGAVCSAMTFGNFDDLIIAMWGMLDILVDPYTNSSTGSVRVRALQDVDIKVRHTESFQNMLDILA